MTSEEVVLVINDTPASEMGDVLLRSAINWWLSEGVTKDEVLYLVETILNEDG